MPVKLFYEDEFDALEQMVASCPHKRKEIAAFIFPDHKPETAYAKLMARMNRFGDERFTYTQVLRLMLFCNAYDPLYYACDELLHARPARVAPEDEEVKLVEAINGAAKVMQSAMAQIERLQPRKARR